MFEYHPEEELHVRVWLQAPSTRQTMEEVQSADGSALRAIQEAEELIAQLKQYRLDLAARAQRLSVAPYTHRLELTREHHYYGNRIYYYVTLYKVYIDSALGEVVEQNTKYPGTERHTAIKDFETIKKSRPGIECRVDIERRGWEKR